MGSNTPPSGGIVGGLFGPNKDAIEQIIQKYDVMVEALTEKQAEVVKQVLMAVKGEVDIVVPVDTGALKESWKIKIEQADGKRIVGTLTYGGESKIRSYNNPDGVVRYAGLVHAINTPYLNAAVSAAQPKIQEIIKKEFGQAIKGSKSKTVFFSG